MGLGFQLVYVYLYPVLKHIWSTYLCLGVLLLHFLWILLGI